MSAQQQHVPDGHAPGRILVGTASWTDPSLVNSGRFYPPDARTPAARLQFYAQQFPIVEIDSSYYGIPAERTAGLWTDRSPAGFTFDVKAYALFTQHAAPVASLPKDVRNALPAAVAGHGRIYQRDVPDELLKELWRRFETALLPLDSAGKLGCVLFQFPPWFTPNRESYAYLAALREELPGYTPSVEFRNPLWLDDDHREGTLALLREHSLPFVCVDEPQGTSASVPPVVAVTASVALIRFHGRNAAAWAAPGVDVRDKYDYSYTDAELRGWLPGITRLAEEAADVHVLMNNCVEDKGVNNARDIVRLLREESPVGAALVPPPPLDNDDAGEGSATALQPRLL